MIEIKVDDLGLRDMHWDSVSDWTRLCPSKINAFGYEYVAKEDVMRFYDMVVKDIARKISQDYQKVKEIIDAENTPFMEYVAQIFERKKYYSKEDLQIHKLKGILLVPQADATLRCMERLYYSLPYAQMEAFKKFVKEH
ncbi:MAG: hypothetical protein IJ272_05000 [Clostridia bacterium]|nr:hypothetical protein [Clostridia bacterium]